MRISKVMRTPPAEIAVDAIAIDIEGDFQFPQIVKDPAVPWHQCLTRLAFRSRSSLSFRLRNWKRQSCLRLTLIVDARTR